MITAPVRCRVPADFAPVDLAASPQQRAESLRTRLPADAPGVEDLTAQNEAFAQQLLAFGACYAAVFVLPPNQAGYFAITEPSGPPPDLDTLAVRLAADPDADVRSTDLPCGPAVTCVEYAEVADPSGQSTIDVVQEHALVIHPANGRLVAFTLGVHDAHRRPEYLHLFTEILNTVSFSQ